VNEQLVITCEHGGNRVPAPYARLFRATRRALQSHRAYDPGALDLARLLARRLRAPLFFSCTTRLLVDLNRSVTHRSLFSRITSQLSSREKQAIISAYYVPLRERAAALVARAIDQGCRVIHLSIHTFAPVLRGRIRNADIGLLYDPSRDRERELATALRAAILETVPWIGRHRLRIRRNYPYRGTSDGFTASLRHRFPTNRYAGIELEVNQRWARGSKTQWAKLQKAIADAAARLWDNSTPM